MAAPDYLGVLTAAGLPVIGLSISDPDNPATWRFDGELTDATRQAARAIVATLLEIDGAAVAPTLPASAGTVDGGAALPAGGTTTIDAGAAAAYVPTVLELLTASRSAHLTYRARLTYALGQSAREALASASALRSQADALDPDHLDPAWADDPAPHAELMAFYATQLAR